MTQPVAENKARTRRRVIQGIVVSNKCAKTIRVQVAYTVPHPKYGKLMAERTVLYAHDETSEGRPGDVVELMECRRRSKTKSWRLVRVVRPAPSE